ncbi:ComEA family DNA-binding protein [Arthrobacter oryzae]|uniref:ComEA family DNA-binding protein n=1 Tax=Arthrobacter oryzae TaxID=409290 RepID=UPI00273B2ED9|nr:helix-hairpin-helix domain-containing protein [Arthrobacter oryzae]WLQ06209.1 helix-hairpin-helix domain-containing protein [Arthrobacter oryzae]
MSRRNAEARAPAAATRARLRLTASLSPAGTGEDHNAGDDGNAAGTGKTGLTGLLQQVAGPAGSQPFTYDGGAQPAPGGIDASSGHGTLAPANFRWRTGLRVAVVLGILSLLLGGWFWWDVAVSRPRVVPLSDVSSPEARGQPEAGPGAEPPAESGGPAAEEARDAASGAKIVVHVAGAVNRAGVVELPPGSRIHEAIAAAGGSGPGADLNRLNLAALLTDGQKIHVPQLGDPVDSPGTAASETGPGGGGSGTGAGEPGADSAKIDLNTATVEELGALPRVGPVLAQRIVDWRKEHGRFSSVEELDAVDGVGPKMLETLLPLVRIS